MSGSSRPKSPTGSVAGSVRNIGTILEKDVDMGDAGENDSSTTSHTKVRIDFFTGNRYKLNAFLVQVKMAFDLDKDKFDHDAAKTTYAASYLRGGAFNWFEPYVSEWLNKKRESSEATKRFFREFSHFENQLRTIYGTVDEARAAARDIHNLKQGRGSVASYYAMFQQHMSKLKWDESAKHAAFYAGLNDSVKDEFKPAPPKEFDQLVEQAIQYDNRHFERKLERDGGRGPNYSRNRGYKGRSRGTYDHYGPAPMDLDMLNRKPSRFQKGRRGGSMGGKERERRRKENLCFTCGKSGHRAAECDNASGRALHMIVKESTGTPAKKADTGVSTARYAGDLPNNDEGKGQAQKDFGDSEYGIRTPWEEHLARVRGLPEGAYWSSDDDTPESQEDDSPWVVVPAKASTSRAVEKPKRAHDKSQREERLGRANPREPCPEGVFCLDMRCKGHGASRTQIAESLEEAELRNDANRSALHAVLHWTACEDDSCSVHQSAKDNAGIQWYPAPVPYPKGAPTAESYPTDITRDGDHPDHHELPNHACNRTYCYWHGRKGTTETVRPVSRERKRPQEPQPKEKIRQRPRRRTTTVVVREESDYEASDGKEAYTLCMINAEEPVTSPYFKKEEETEALAGPSAKPEELEEDGESSNSDDDGDPYEVPDLPEARAHDGVTEGKPLVVTGINRSSLLVVTNRWRFAWCEPSTCTVESQHVHVLLDHRARPKQNVRTFRLQVCLDENCDEEKKHSHYPPDTPYTVTFPENIQRQLRLLDQPHEQGSTENNIDMIIRQVGTIGKDVDERGDKEYASKDFECIDIGCSQFFTIHRHLFNVDPRYPEYALTPLEFMRARRRLGACREATCEWKENLHIHIDAKNVEGKDQ